ncbi:choice-of-anchor L domain-containing protein [Flavobacterium selenitireducens]|uniref:choice-of-anchor L domain-containing protein n=1 Tax=Flavobacterium selenitireducens TaxID=2722704 RepID=UPI00168C0F7A|nr:choice-of-anchor L domain-containing protein [Flavobacterium selenitireducens]MBD3583719.1 T9SS type B sorting domain-containing protein [Flavobacterium selenitireducens]
MRKITLFLVLLLFGFGGFAQHETFDDSSVTPPTGLGPWILPSGTWQVLDNGIGNLNWTLSSTSTYPANSAPNAAYVNRQNIGAGNTSRDYLISPAWTVPNNPQLRFQSRTTLAGFDNTVLEVRAALGTSDPTDPASFTYVLGQWNDDLINMVQPYNVYEEKVIDLPDFGGATTIYIAFVKVTTQATNSQTGDRWLVDDIHLVEKCQDADPESLVSNASTATNITLQWDGTENNQWEVHVVPAGTVFNPNVGTPITVNGTPTTTVTATTQPTPTPFTPLTCYDFYVRSVCEFASGEWVGPSPSAVCTQALPPECGGNYVDSGGIDADYGMNEASTITICPEQAGDIVTVTFTAFSVEQQWDGLYVYDGNGTNDPLIPSSNGPGNNNNLDTPGAYWGNSIPGPFESSSPDGCLTFQFFSDGFGTQDGWTANVTCSPAPTCPKPTAVTGLSATDQSVNLSWTPVGPATLFEVIALAAGSPAPGPGDSGIQTTGTTFTYTGLASSTCFDFYVRARCSDSDISSWSLKASYCTQVTPPECGGVFVDEGGPNANYPLNSATVVTICPEQTGDIVTVSFTSFAVESAYDGLYIYDGDSVNDPLIPSNNGSGNNDNLDTPGAYWGTNNPGTFESSSADGCLTFQFFSDGFFNLEGWTANVTCGPAPTCPKPTALTLGAPTATTLPVSWTPVGPATTWHVYAIECGGTPPVYGQAGFQVATGTPSIELIDLNSSTCYEVYVISVCSESPVDVSNPAGPRTAITLVAPPVCDGVFVDDGGPLNYPNQSNSVVTICPEIPGEQVTVTFTMFDTENNWDGLYVFDGDSTSDPMIASDNPAGNVPFGEPGAYWGNTIPGPFTASSADGCLTFLFSSDFSVNYQGWMANVTCLPPPTCPKPTAVTIDDTTDTTVTVSWTEVGSATQWHVLVLPATDPVPDANTPGWELSNTTTYTYGTITPLTPSTPYKVYVRAFCSADDISLWTNPKSFATAPVNDDCADAIVAPVNDGVSCAESVPGTLIGGTPSTQENTCSGTADDDIWFQFTAETTAHAINLNNIQGNAFSLNMALYAGTCEGLDLVTCESFVDQMVVSPLVPGQVYLVRVWTDTDQPNQNSTFDFCVSTVPPPIATSIDQYTIEELVEDVLLNSTCANVSNITYSTGTNYNSTPGIGYFNKNGSTFQFDEGVVMTSGNVLNAPGPNDSVLSDGEYETWPGDADLEAIILAATGQPMNSMNASILEFDFIPITPSISFNFLFASDEYGTFQCTFSDAFAFLLTDINNNTTTNLAVIPGTGTPVSVVTIRDELYNGGCASVNPQYFDEYYLLPEGSDPLGAPINFNGVTVPLTAQATVNPGTPYHIKLVIADRQDNSYDSAVFLEGGSFDIGNIELGDDFVQADGTALCAGSSFVLNSGLDPEQYTFSWTQDGEVIPNANGSTYTVTEPGVYGVTAVYNTSSCTASDAVTIEFYPPLQPGTPEDLYKCDESGFAAFTLSEADASILNGASPAAFQVTYYLTQADAEASINPLPNIYTNVLQFQQTIYANMHTASGCFAIVALDLVVSDDAPEFTITEDFTICEGSSEVITVTPLNANQAVWTYSWTWEGNPLPDTTPTITVTQAGTYVVTVNNAGCTGTGTVVVTTIPATVAPELADVEACDSYTLPALTDANLTYTTGPNCTGAVLAAGTVITTTQTVYVCATTGTCINSTEFEVVINATPNVGDFQAVVACDSYALPALAVGGYFGQPGGVDPITGDLGVGVHTVYVYAATGTAPNVCFDQASFVVTVTASPVADDLQDVSICQGAVFTLPVLSAGNAYFGAAGGTGTSYQAGDQISQTTTVYVYAVSPDNGDCFDETSFTVTVTAEPEFTLEAGCQDNAYTITATAVNYDPATASYNWSSTTAGEILTGQGTPSITVSGAATYTLVVTVATCDGTDNVVATSTSCTIQKGISANGDGANDFFDLEGFNVRQLQIFNRYGSKVYERTNYVNEWKGQSDKGEELPDGTYYYVIERRDGEPTKTGWIYINRKN